MEKESPYEKLARICEERGIRLLTREEDYLSWRTKASCLCTRCEKEYQLSVYSLQRKENGICRGCLIREKSVKFLEIGRADCSERPIPEEYRKEFLKKGFTIIQETMNANHKKIKCVCSCGEERMMTITQIRNNKTGCINCSRAGKRTSWARICERAAECGHILITKKEDYKGHNSSEDRIQFICSCSVKQKNPPISTLNAKNFTARGGGCNKCLNKRREETCLEKYGTTNVSHNEEIKDKIRKNQVIGMREKYGVDYCAQHPEIYQKILESSFKLKEFRFPSGKMVKVQGYEPFAILYLLNDYEEDDMLFGKDIPQVSYTLNDKKRMYHPDIYIPCDNLMVEVKSKYTSELDPDEILAKREGTLNAGYDYLFLIFDKEGNCVKNELSFYDESDDE